MLLPVRALLLACVVSVPALAQVPEAPGPHAVGWDDVSFTHPLSANPTVTARLYYPALSAGQGTAPDTSAGPFPLVGFLHGYFAFVDYYDDVCTHLASHGFFVASVATESGLFMSIPNEAKDARAMLTWTEAQALPGGSFDGMVAQGADWSAVGHSNGGAARSHLASAEPRIARLVLFEPNWLSPPGVTSFAGPVMVVGATEDTITPTGSNAATYFANLQASPRSSYVQVVGAGHNASLDFPFGATSLPHAEAHAMHRRLAAGFLLAEVKGELQQYELLVGAAAELEPLDPVVRATQPVLWVSSGAGHLGMGLAGRGDDAFALLAVSTVQTSLPTAFGQLGVDLGGALLKVVAMTSDGSVDLSVPFDPALAGLGIFTQGLRLAADGSGALTAVVSSTL
ncbi:MAG: hypothetical protein P1V81_08400 [Planctomycetota bacterium]|nr:hypothetical protein [Planctomycetota bacterium]